MSLRNTIEVITDLAKRGVIKQYAIAGAVAALYYIEPTATEDLDILVSVSDFGRHKSGLLLLSPIESELAKMGYSERKDVGIVIDDWPVQFLPVASDLDAEALENASEIEVPTRFGDGSPLKARILKAEYIVATALKLGRLKDLVRIEAFLAHKAVDLVGLKTILERFDLVPAWKAFCFKAGKADPLG
jgi:hypothetical protein